LPDAAWAFSPGGFNIDENNADPKHVLATVLGNKSCPEADEVKASDVFEIGDVDEDDPDGAFA